MKRKLIYSVVLILALIGACKNPFFPGKKDDGTKLGGNTKADPTVTWPADLTAVYGQRLSDIQLASYTNDPAGTFAWTTPTDSVGLVGSRSHSMTFTPTDTANYNTVTEDVEITVQHVPVEMVNVGAGSFQMGKDLGMAATATSSLASVLPVPSLWLE